MNHYSSQERSSAGGAARPATERFAAGFNGLRTAAAPAGVQAKLTVNQPGDRFEREADHVADQVMRMAGPNGAAGAGVRDGAGSAIQRACAECEKEKHVHRKETTGGQPHVTPQLQRQIESFRGGGNALPSSERAFMEPRFGTDFGHVRVHTGPVAAETAGALNARAYTVGSDIVFGAGEYAPGTSEGRRLIAHELVHTIQQSGGGGVAARAMRKSCPACAHQHDDRGAVSSHGVPGIQRAGAPGVPATSPAPAKPSPSGRRGETDPVRKPNGDYQPGPKPLPPGPIKGMTTHRFRAAALSYLSCAPCNPFTDDGTSGVTPPVSEPKSNADFRQSHHIEAELGTTDGKHIATGTARLLSSSHLPGISHYCNKSGTAKIVAQGGPLGPMKITNSLGVEGIQFASSMFTRVGATVPATLPGVPCGYLGDNALIPFIGNVFAMRLYADGTRDSYFITSTLFPSHNLYEDGVLKQHNGKPVHPQKDYYTWASSTTGLPESLGRIGFKAMRFACCNPVTSKVACPTVCLAGLSATELFGAMPCAIHGAALAAGNCPASCARAGATCSSLTESSNP